MKRFIIILFLLPGILFSKEIKLKIQPKKDFYEMKEKIYGSWRVIDCTIFSEPNCLNAMENTKLVISENKLEIIPEKLKKDLFMEFWKNRKQREITNEMMVCNLKEKKMEIFLVNYLKIYSSDKRVGEKALVPYNFGLDSEDWVYVNQLPCEEFLFGWFFMLAPKRRDSLIAWYFIYFKKEE